MTIDINDREYPSAPHVGVGVVLFNKDKVLFVKRGHEPALGEWTVPGGLVHIGESIHEAAKRELLEECGVDADMHNVVDIFEYIDKNSNGKIKYHYIVVEIRASYTSGTARASSDAADARWVNLDELEDFPCSIATKTLVKKAMAS